MDFVALLSGGKDSCYNILKCLQYGHQLVCLANLAPPASSSTEEIHSYMYQSAGASVLPAYAECLGVPLIRRDINGSAINQGLDYEVTNENDEVEDLYILLKEVMKQFPNVKGVSCGAIISSYQRFRVENVCERLGLTVLSYLWQRDRTILIEEIINSGINAVLVKVAGAGLDPYKHLGKSLGQLLPTLQKLHKKYGLDLCGEGGEYESLVLDAPFFQKRIELITSSTVIDEEDSSVGMLYVKEWKCVEKTSGFVDPKALCNDNIPSPLHFQNTFLSSLIQRIPSFQLHSTSSLPASSSSSFSSHVSTKYSGEVTIGNDGFGYTSLLLPTPVTSSTTSTTLPTTISQQVHDLFAQLTRLLTPYSPHSHRNDIIFVHLYLKTMTSFAAVNTVYCEYFGKYPPSRSCVMMSGLPDGIEVALHATVYVHSYASMLTAGCCSSDSNRKMREVLHVKSMSEWAPLCIGPYAQANTIQDFFITIAGQIPLHPATMQLYHPPPLTPTSTEPPSSNPEVLLQHRMEDLLVACQHALQILSTLSSSLSSVAYAVLYINQSPVYASTQCTIRYDTLFRACLLAYLRQDVRKREQRRKEEIVYDAMLEDWALDEEEEDEEHDDDEEEEQEYLLPPIVIVGVEGLPRESALEVEMIGYKEGILQEIMVEGVEETAVATGMKKNGWIVQSQPIRLPLVVSTSNTTNENTESSESMKVVEQRLSTLCNPLFHYTLSYPPPPTTATTTATTTTDSTDSMHSSSQEKSDDRIVHGEVYGVYKLYPPCLGSGVLTYTIPTTTTSITTSTSKILSALLTALQHLLHTHQLTSSLRTVRFYYLPQYFPQSTTTTTVTGAATNPVEAAVDTLTALSPDELTILLQQLLQRDYPLLPPVAIICLPVHSLPSSYSSNSTDTVCCQLLFYAIDFYQIETERWILQAKK